MFYFQSLLGKSLFCNAKMYESVLKDSELLWTYGPTQLCILSIYVGFYYFSPYTVVCFYFLFL